jgi:hypothetical protein
MLALIKKHLEIAQETMETTDENADAAHPGAIPTNATLSLLPSHLVDQLGKDISQAKARYHDDGKWQQFYRKEGTDTRKSKRQ